MSGTEAGTGQESIGRGITGQGTADDRTRGGRATAAQRQALGVYGETLAARYLVEQGMVVLDRNWRCDAGELDLVLRDDEVLVVCEVKSRTSTACGHPLEAVGDIKVARLRRLAARWLADRHIHPRDVRIDIVGVLVPKRGSALIEHVTGIG
ncbi:MAG: YraN family protein [Nocardioides sp.]